MQLRLGSGSGSVLLPCDPPWFSPGSGPISAGTPVFLFGLESGAIYYTTDGTLPNVNTSKSLPVDGLLSVDPPETIKALAYRAGVCSASSVVTAIYTVADAGPADGGPTLSACPTPTFSPGAGAIAAGTNVVLAAAGLPASGFIFFTTDGTLPNITTSKVYTGGTSGMQVNQSETIIALGYAAGVCSPSAVATADYTVTSAPPSDGGNSTPGTPLFTPAGGATFDNNLTVGIASSGATSVCYTIDGTTPSCMASGSCGNGSAYSGFVALPPTGSTSTTGDYPLSAIGCAAGSESSVKAQNYTMVAAMPVSTLAAGSQTWFNLGSGDWVCYATGPASSIVSPACGASAGVCTTGTLLTLTDAGTGAIPIATSGTEVEAISYAPAGLTSSGVATGGPYTLQLSSPYVLAVADGTTPAHASSSYTLTGSTSIVIGQADASAGTVQQAGFACLIEDPEPGVVAACGAPGRCGTNATLVPLRADGTYWDTGDGGIGNSFGPGDSVSTILCPPETGAGSGYLPSPSLTVNFVATGSDGGTAPRGDAATDAAKDSTSGPAADAGTDAGTDAGSDAPTTKRIFVTNASVEGNLGGVSGADSLCSSDSNNPGGTFKALIVDGTNRTACTTASSGCLQSQNVNWVVRPNQTYTRVDGTVVGTTNAAGIFLTMAVAVSTTSATILTGLDDNWLANADDPGCSGGACNCNFFAASDAGTEYEYYSAYASSTSTVASSSASEATTAFGGEVNSCDTSAYLYCVEQ